MIRFHDPAMVPAAFTDSHQQALELDLWILSSTLSHGRSSHKRTIHYQRLQMAKSCFLRYRLTFVAKDWQDFTDQLRDFKNPVGVPEREAEKRLAIGNYVGALDTENVNMNKDAASRLQSRLKDLRDRMVSGLDDFYSRAFHASQAGMAEMGRGHFLPFLIVTYASIARLRSLLLRLQAKVKLVDIPALLQMHHVWNVDDTIMEQIRADLVLLRDSITLVSDQTMNIIGPPDEAQRHVQLLANIGLQQATKKPKKDRALMQERHLSSEANNDTGQKMTHTEKGTPAPPTTGIVDALDGNAKFLTLVREKSKKKRKETTKSKEAPIEKKRAKVKKVNSDFFDELFG